MYFAVNVAKSSKCVIDNTPVVILQNHYLPVIHKLFHFVNLAFKVCIKDIWQDFPASELVEFIVKYMKCVVNCEPINCITHTASNCSWFIIFRQVRIIVAELVLAFLTFSISLQISLIRLITNGNDY